MYLKKLDIHGNLFMMLRSQDIDLYWNELDPYKDTETKKNEKNEQENNSSSFNQQPETDATTSTNNSKSNTNDTTATTATNNDNGVNDANEMSARDRMLLQHNNGSNTSNTSSNVVEWNHYNMINHKMRSTVVVSTVQGDDRVKPSLIVQSVLGCMIGAIERFADADVPGNAIPAGQMTMEHFYNIALEEGDDHLFQRKKKNNKIDGIIMFIILFFKSLYFFM